MNNLINPSTFNGHNIPIIMHHGEPHMSGEAIGMALEYSNPRNAIKDIYRRNHEELNEYSVGRKLRSTDGKMYETRIYSEEGVMIITMRSNQPVARDLRRWFVQIIKAHRHNMLEAPGQIMALKRQMDKALLKLRPDWKKIIRYKGYGLSNREIGKLMDMHPRTVRREMRAMEDCGLLTPPKNLAMMQQGVLRIHDGMA